RNHCIDSALLDTHNGSGQRAFSASAAAALRNLPALPAQALAGIQERLAHRVQIGDNSPHESPNRGAASCARAFISFVSSPSPAASLWGPPAALTQVASSATVGPTMPS